MEKLVIGNTVKITNRNKTYIQYAHWSGLRGYEDLFRKHWEPRLDTTITYKVVNIAKHDIFEDRMLALIQDIETKYVYIVNINALEKV